MSTETQNTSPDPAVFASPAESQAQGLFASVMAKQNDPYPHLTPEQKAIILERQFQLANSGSEALLIHLGQTELNQVKTERRVNDDTPALIALGWDEVLRQLGSIANTPAPTLTVDEKRADLKKQMKKPKKPKANT